MHGVAHVLSLVVKVEVVHPKAVVSCDEDVVGPLKGHFSI